MSSYMSEFLGHKKAAASSCETAARMSKVELLKLGHQPVQFTLGGRYFPEKPQGGPDWGLRFTVTLLFPK
jgi:hypothetical protein